MSDQETSGEGLGLSLAKRIVLLFEGDVKLAHRLEKTISQTGYQAKGPAEIKKGLYPAIARAARVLVWDSDSPAVTREDLRSILAQEKNLPVIVLTGSHKIDTRIEELRPGTSSEYLFKPFSEEKFREALLRALDKAEHAEKYGYLPQEPTSAAAVPEAPPTRREPMPAAAEVPTTPEIATPPKEITAPDLQESGPVNPPEVVKMPQNDEQDDWAPVLSFQTWYWIQGSFAGLCLIILAIDLFIGPSKVPVILIFIGAAGILTMTALAIYEWWHWVST